MSVKIDSLMSIENRIGPPVEGKDFYGREKELGIANRLLDSGHSLLLSAPRRIGKSSFAKRLIEDKKAQGWKCVYIDLEQTTTEDGFLYLIIEYFERNHVWRQKTDGMLQGAKAILDRINKISIGPVGFDLSSPERKEDLYKSLKELIRHDEETFIVVDEFTLFLGILLKSDGGEEKVSFILNWLRSLRQVAGTKVRWLFCGSVGLKNFTASLNLSYAINDLTDFSLDELTPEEARGLMEGLCQGEGMNMDEENIIHALEKLHWNIPYFIQILFSKLRDNYTGAVSKEDIDTAYGQLCSESYLNTWSERLAEYREMERPARLILNGLSARRSGLRRETLLGILMTGQYPSNAGETDLLLSKVLEMLENDGYLLRKGPVRSFRSPLLRDYWYGKFVQ